MRPSRAVPTCTLAAALLAARVAAGAEPQTTTFQDLFALGGVAYEAKDWPRCAELFTQAARAAKADRQASRGYFAAAACATARGERDGAFALLDLAAGKGYRDVDHTGTNPELAPLRNDLRWRRFVAGVRYRGLRYTAHLEPELTRLYREDQSDHSSSASGVDKTEIARRDGERRKRALEILGRREVRAADDAYHAAILLQRGENPEDLEKAHELSLEALRLDPDHPTVRWLAATTKDRALMTRGKPQLYGTQMKKVEDRWVLWEVDHGVSDEERAKWDAPSLAVARQKVEERNRKAPPQP